MDSYITLEPQEFDDVDYKFTNIPMVATPNLLNQLEGLGGKSAMEIIFLAHLTLLETRQGNKDYLQVFHYHYDNNKDFVFWAISNQESSLPNCEESCLTWLLGEDY